MRYEKAETVLRVALDMQASALGLSLEEIQRNYSDQPLSRLTAERLRDAIERLFPQIEQANPGEVPKRWRLPGGTVNGLANITAAELADLGTAISLLRREGMDVQAENAERGVAKMRALVKRQMMNRLEPDLEALTEAEGLAMRPGPRAKIDAEIVSTLREAIITRRKVRLHYHVRQSEVVHISETAGAFRDHPQCCVPPTPRLPFLQCFPVRIRITATAADALSKRFTQALVDTAEVLTPEQRQKLEGLLPPVGGWHGWWRGQK